MVYDASLWFRRIFSHSDGTTLKQLNLVKIYAVSITFLQPYGSSVRLAERYYANNLRAALRSSLSCHSRI